MVSCIKIKSSFEPIGLLYPDTWILPVIPHFRLPYLYLKMWAKRFTPHRDTSSSNQICTQSFDTSFMCILTSAFVAKSPPARDKGPFSFLLCVCLRGTSSIWHDQWAIWAINKKDTAITFLPSLLLLLLLLLFGHQEPC